MKNFFRSLVSRVTRIHEELMDSELETSYGILVYTLLGGFALGAWVFWG